jgi:hypothetical protein
MLKIMENQLNESHLNNTGGNNLFFLNENKLIKIPKLYQKKKVPFLYNSNNKPKISSIKKYEKYTKIFKSKLLKFNNGIHLYNKSSTLNNNYMKNLTLNKSNINTINTTMNNSNNNTFFNNTNNNSITKIISKNLFSNNNLNYKVDHNKNNLKDNFNDKKIDENNIKNDINEKLNNHENIVESDEDANIKDLINDETEEKMPVHISNYNGGLRGNRDWGLSKTDVKGDKLISFGKGKYVNSSNIKKDNANNFKFQALLNNCGDIKKKLLYEGKNKLNNAKKNINLEIKNINNKILFSPNTNIENKIKKLNFDQPFKYIKISNSNKNIIVNRKNSELNKLCKVPRIEIDLTKKENNFTLKKSNNMNTNPSSNETTRRNIREHRKGINSIDKSFGYNPTEESSFNKDTIKNRSVSPRNNILDVNNAFFHSKDLLNKYNDINYNQSERDYKAYKFIFPSTIKRNNLNERLIRYDNIINLNKNKTKTNLNDFIFEIGNIKFKHYIENLLDDKSLIILSSLNKNFYKNFRNVIYNKYYNYIILDENNRKEYMNKIIKSLLKYSSSKLKNISKAEIGKIYNSFNYKSIYNENIIKDLPRTFPNDSTFNKNSLGYYKLYNILTSYSNFNKQIGYTQGLNFISAIGLSLFDSEQEVFVFLDGLINRFELDKFMGINNKYLVSNLKYFSNILNKYVPDIISFFDNKLLNHEFFSTNWILTLFSNCMSKNELIIIWCFMIVFGWKFFYCFAIELLNFYKEDIFQTNENELNYKMKKILNDDKFEGNLNVLIKNTFQLMKNNISL